MLKREASTKLKPFQYQERILYHRFSLMTVGLIQVYCNKHLLYCERNLFRSWRGIVYYQLAMGI